MSLVDRLLRREPPPDEPAEKREIKVAQGEHEATMKKADRVLDRFDKMLDRYESADRVRAGRKP